MPKKKKINSATLKGKSLQELNDIFQNATDLDYPQDQIQKIVAKIQKRLQKGDTMGDAELWDELDKTFSG